MESTINSNYQILDIVKSISQLFSFNKVIHIKVPTNVIKRAELMCMYIEDDIDCDFKIDNLMMLLYMDFVKYAVKNYNPTRVLKEATRKQRNFEDSDTIKLQINGEVQEVKRKNTINYSTLEIKIPKKEYQKGQLILDELQSLYGCTIPFGVMFGNLLVNFIEDYKDGTNKRAYTSIVKILKRVYIYDK